MGKSLVSCFLTHGVDGSDPLFSIILFVLSMVIVECIKIVT